MDFYNIAQRENQKKEVEIYPSFQVDYSKDLMVRGGNFYAIWDEEAGLWCTDSYIARRMIDQSLQEYERAHFDDLSQQVYRVRYLKNSENNSWGQFLKYMKEMPDNYNQLDDNLIFANTPVKKTDYASKRLPYPLEDGDFSAWDELIGTLYSVDERAKIEWAIGAIVSGDSKRIQKFLVLYGPAGTGKSTILNIVQKLFDGYTATFEAKALGGNNNAFATEAFKSNPLVAIQHDGDLSKIEDNTKLNSIIAHEDMMMNEKYKPSYTARVNAFLFMGTNQPVKITDAKSGIIRRLIDVHPTGAKLPANHYHTLMGRIDFELGAIAHHCLQVYREMGKNYYNAYRPTEMMFQTDLFFNFIEAHFDIFKAQDGTSLKQAYKLYKEYCAETGIEKLMPQYKFREELRNYFDEFHMKQRIDGVDHRSVYSGFNADKFKTPIAEEDGPVFSLVLEETQSLLDDMYADMPATEAVYDETINGFRPRYKWKNVKTTLKDLDTSEMHYVKIPENHIVIDFDLKDDNGEKSLEANLQAASIWPPTYAELSQGGNGVHLHYTYDGDPSQLAAHYSDGIEVKTLLGDAALRRRVSHCNNVPVAWFVGQLPLKEKNVLDKQTMANEMSLRNLIGRNLRKEIHPGTKPSIDFIHKILEDAYVSGMQYDVSDLRSKILAFAANSSNQSLQSMKIVQSMKFKSEESDRPTTETVWTDQDGEVSVTMPKDERISFYDIEVYPDLFVVCWKFDGADSITKMVNPSAMDIETLLGLKLVGFNNRRYDNHIVYAGHMDYGNDALYALSQKIINNDRSGMFGEAYNLSYTDIFDFSSKKQSLKKFMIDLGIHKMEMNIPWDVPVAETAKKMGIPVDELIQKIVDYCCNDVLGTEATFHARKQDFVARQVLSELSGLSVNDTTQKHTARIIFGKDREPQRRFVYTDLSKEFPGYTFDPMRKPKSDYMGEDPSEGGYVYAEPGMYENVAVFDVASMHPTSLIQLNAFGDEYTKNFADLKAARIAIKHKKFDEAKQMLGGALAPYLKDEKDADALAYALKIVINTVYGLTSASFPNPFRDDRNKDNIVAKRGALFMIWLKHQMWERGFKVVHIKTDSIKIAADDPKMLERAWVEVQALGQQYGYDFEWEDTYDKFCLVNDAVYIAKKGEKWNATGAQFQHPYVYKTLFTGGEVTFDDYCETKQVAKGAIYMDFDWNRPMALGENNMVFVGKIGRFVPVVEGGAILYRVQDGKNFAVTGTKDWFWLDAEIAKTKKVEIDMSYFNKLADDAVTAIEKFGNFDEFVK